MPDIFDQVADGASSKAQGDIFDQVAGSAGDPLAPGATPPAGSNGRLPGFPAAPKVPMYEADGFSMSGNNPLTLKVGSAGSRLNTSPEMQAAARASRAAGIRGEMPGAANFGEALITGGAKVASDIGTGLKDVYTPTDAEMRAGISSGGRGGSLPAAASMTDEEKQAAYTRTAGGAAKVISGASTAALALGAPELLEMGSAAIAGDAAAQAGMTKAILGAGIGQASSSASGAVADKAGVTPETKNLIQAAAFFLPTLTGAYLGTRGFKAGAGVDAEGNSGIGASSPHGTVRAGVVASPEAYDARVQVGGTRVGVRIPRAPSPTEVVGQQVLDANVETMRQSTQADAAAQAIVNGASPQEAVAAQQPKAPPTPSEMAAAQMFPNPVIKQDHMTAAAEIIKALPPEDQGAATLQAHDQLSAQIAKWQTFVGPDGKTYSVNSPKDAAKYASQFINAEVDKHDANLAEAQKQQTAAAKPANVASPPTPAIPGKGKSTLQQTAQDQRYNRARTMIESSASPEAAMAAMGRAQIPPAEAQAYLARHQAEQAPTVGSKAEPVVEESRKTVDAQIDALKAGTINVVMQPAGSKYAPEKPVGMSVLDVKGNAPGAGRYFYNPLVVSPRTIREAAKNGTHGDLMGHVATKAEAAAAPSTVAVVAHQPDGTEIQASEVPASIPHVQAQVAAMAERHPAAQVSVKPVDEVVGDRLKAQAEEGKPDIFDEVGDADAKPSEVAQTTNEGSTAEKPEQAAAAAEMSQPAATLDGATAVEEHEGRGVATDEVRSGTAGTRSNEISGGSGGSDEATRRAGDSPERGRGRAVEPAAVDAEGDTGVRRQPEPQGAGKNLEVAAPKEHKYSFGSTQANLPKTSAASKGVDALRAKIAKADLAGDGIDIDENHVTVRYGIQGADTAGVRAYLKSQAPFEAKLGKTEMFKPTKNSDGAAVIQTPVLADDLHRMNEEIAKHGDFKDSDFPDYKPHVTVAYVKPEAAKKYVGLAEAEGKTFKVTAVSISDRDGNKEEIKLEGTPKAAQEKTPAAPSSFAVGDKVKFKSLAGKELSGTVKHVAASTVRLLGEDHKRYDVPKKNVRGGAPSTAAERQAEIAKIKKDNSGVLSTPLYSEGAIGPAQTARFSKNQFEKLQADQQERMDLERQIRELSRSDDKIAADTKAEDLAEIRKQRPGLMRRIRDIESLGAMSHKANGELKKGYQIAWDDATVKLAALDAQEMILEARPAKAEKQESPPRALHGGSTSIITPTRDLAARYRLMEASTLVPSHDAQSFAKNTAYPDGVQERAYDTSKEAQARVISQAQKYDPRYTITDNPDATNGPPIVTPDGIVLGGNSRTMSTQRLYAAGEGKVYRDALETKAAQFGFKPEDVAAMKSPVLVREVEHPGDKDAMRRLATELNKVPTAAMSGSEKAVSAGKNIKAETLQRVAEMLGDGGTIRELMANPRDSKAIVGMLEADGAITERERPGITDPATGGLNDAGKDFVENALLGSMVDDPRVMDSTPKSILNKVEGSLGSISTFAGRPDEWNLLPALRAALVEHGEMARAGNTIDDHIGQVSMFAPPRNPMVDAIMRVLDGSAKGVRKAFAEYAQDAKADVPGQSLLLGNAPEPYDGFNHAFGAKLTPEEYRNALIDAAPSEAPQHGRSGLEEADPQGDGGVPGARAGDAGAEGAGVARKGSGDAGLFGPTAGGLRSSFFGLDLAAEGLGRAVKAVADTPAAQEVVGAAKSFIDEFIHDDRPTTGDMQRGMMRQTRGQMDRRIAVAAKVLETSRATWAKRPKEDSIAFFNAVEHVDGKTVDDLPAADRELAQHFKAQFDTMRHDLQELKPNVLQDFIENYFPHIWDRQAAASKTIAQIISGSKPFSGKGSFLKQRTIPTIQDGLDMGLKPVSYNPVDLFLLKYQEQSRFLMGHQTLANMKEAGTAQFVRIGEKAPEGWQQLDDKIGTVQSKTDDGGLVIRGHYYAPPDAARIFNNFVSRGIAGRSNIYDSLRWTNNNINAFQLGISAFHVSTTSIVAVASDLAAGLKQLSEGNLAGGATNLAQGVSFFPSIATTLRNGHNLMREYLTPGSYEKFSKEAEALEDAGGRIKQNPLEVKPIERVMQELRNGEKLKGLSHIPSALIEISTRPVMDWWVPRLKAGAFYDMAHGVLNQAARENWSATRTQGEMQRAWDSVDNRFGQMVYDNLFWHKGMKDALMLATRSVGWNAGTIRELGGAAVDTVRQTARSAAGEKPRVTDKMAFAAGLAIATAMVGATLTYLWQKRMPRSVKDCFFPMRPDGTRSGIPGYMKDVYAYAHAPVRTILNKMSPVFSIASELYQNKDFYGVQIRQDDDTLPQQAEELGKYLAGEMVPFSMRGSSKLVEATGHGVAGGVAAKVAAIKDAPGDALMGQLGFQPAPAYIQHTPAENLAAEYAQERRPWGERTQREYDRSQVKHAVEEMYRTGKVDQAQITKYREAGLISQSDVHGAILTARTPPLVRTVRAGKLSTEELLHVASKADAAEQKQLRPMLVAAEKKLKDEPDVAYRIRLKNALAKALGQGEAKPAAPAVASAGPQG